MAKDNFIKNNIPHLVAILIFTILTWTYLFPMIKGKQMAQHDVVQAQGMSQEIRSVFEETGELPLWTNRMFSGMPSYQIWMDYPSSLVTHLINFVKIFFPQTAQYIFLLMLCVYILLYVLTRNHWLSIIAGIAFGLASFNIISLDAGHTGKVRCIAFMAAIIAGVISAFRGKYLFGAALVALVVAMQIRSNHFQITYYTMLMTACFGIYYFVISIRNGTIKSFLKAALVVALAWVLGVGSNTSQLWTSYEYSKETIRGGSGELSSQEEKTDGLGKDYAYSWSYGVGETMTLLIPNFMGGGSGQSFEGSELHQRLFKPYVQSIMVNQGLPRKKAEAQANQIISSYYYHGSQPFTSGPTYFGAIICFLFVLGMLIIRSPIKWALLTISIITIFLAWGKNFDLVPGETEYYFIDIFFDYVPMFNKFRTPAMLLSVTNLIFIVTGGLAIHELVKGEIESKKLLRDTLIAGGVTVGLIFIFGIIGSAVMDLDSRISDQIYQSGLAELLKEERASFIRADSLRSIILVVISGIAILGIGFNKVKSTYFLAGIGLLVLIDLWPVAKRYLNNDDFVTKSEKKSEYIASEADKFILNDKDLSYRVLNLTTSTFNDALTSYHHKSIGGYHAAKIRRYQELIERQISQNMGQLNAGLSNEQIPVLNMLNMRYIIASSDNAIRNPYAMGNAWFVPSFKIVEDANAEMAALSNFDPGMEAIVDKRFKDYLEGLQITDGSGTITLTEYHPNRLKYTAVTSQEQLAVFSEVYYDKGWNAYIDDKPVEHIRANYVLRSLRIPPGEHTIEFRFEPKSYNTGEKVSLAFSCLTLLLVFVALGNWVMNYFFRKD